MGKKQMWQGVLLSAVLMIAGAQLANAAVFTWNFNNPSGAVASPHSYLNTTNAFALTAYGYTTANAGPANPTLGQTWGNGGIFSFNTGSITSRSLYGKTSTPDETGLGLDGLDADHEIQTNSFVQLDLANLLANGFVNMTMIITSVQSTEGFAVWGSNVLGTPGSLIYKGGNPSTGGDVQSFAVPQFGTYRYIAVGSRSADILIGNGLTASTPEPAALMPMLVAMGLLRRRR